MGSMGTSAPCSVVSGLSGPNGTGRDDRYVVLHVSENTIHVSVSNAAGGHGKNVRPALRRGRRRTRNSIDWLEGRRLHYVRTPICLVHVVCRDLWGREAREKRILDGVCFHFTLDTSKACVIDRLRHGDNTETVLQIVLGETGCLVAAEEARGYLQSVLLYSLPNPDTLCTDNLQEPRDSMERNPRGQLRPFLNFPGFLDPDQTSNPSPNLRRPITLTDQHVNSGKFGGGSQSTFPWSTEIPALHHLFLANIQVGEPKSESGGANLS